MHRTHNQFSGVNERATPQSKEIISDKNFSSTESGGKLDGEAASLVLVIGRPDFPTREQKRLPNF